MSDTDLEGQVRAALYAIAPDLEGEALDPTRRYRDQFEFDSMDFLRYVIELHRRTGVEALMRLRPSPRNGTKGMSFRATRSARPPNSASDRSMSARKAAGSALGGWRRR